MVYKIKEDIEPSSEEANINFQGLNDAKDYEKTIIISDDIIKEIVQDIQLARKHREWFGWFAFGFIGLFLIISFIVLLSYSFNWCDVRNIDLKVIIVLIVGINACLLSTVFVLGKIVSRNNKTHENNNSLSDILKIITKSGDVQ